MTEQQWYVLTPAGKAGPFARRADAQAAAGPMGWIVLNPTKSTSEVCNHEVDNPNCQHYS